MKMKIFTLDYDTHRIYSCCFLPEGYRFDLVYDDTDDGTSIHFRDERAFEKLKHIFEYIR